MKSNIFTNASFCIVLYLQKNREYIFHKHDLSRSCKCNIIKENNNI